MKMGSFFQHVKEFDSCKELLKTMQAVHVRVKEHAETCHPACTPQPGELNLRVCGV